MIIKISNLADGVHNFRFDEPIKNADIDEPFFGNVVVNGKINRSYNQLVLDAGIDVDAKFECDRCTAEFTTSVHTNYQMIYLFGEDVAEDDSSNITYLPAETDKINIAGDVRDYAYLAVPMKKLCKESCKGLCYKCGQDLNVEECKCKTEDFDPRWEPLMKLKKNINNSK